MRIVLFYSDIESFNYFTDQLDAELQRRGHETFVFDLRSIRNNTGNIVEESHGMAMFQRFMEGKVDMVFAYDGIGIYEDILVDLWDMKQATAIDIFLDPPFRFHPQLKKHPKKYYLFCCDRNHVNYVKKYFGREVQNVSFLPHAGTYVEKLPQKLIPFKKRKYDILFSGTYYTPESKLLELDQLFEPGTQMNEFFKIVAEYQLKNSTVTADQAILDTVQRLEMSVAEEYLKTMFRCAEPIDWMVRMYHRGRVISALAEAGFDIWLLGRGWENHPASALSNVHRISDRIPFAETLPYMADAKINLNVMPWFKAGTHERIFNILLQHSLPLTDSSSWIDEHFTDGVDIAIYDLEHLEELPKQVEKLLSNHEGTEQMIARGFENVKNHFTWTQCVDQIFEVI